MPTVITFRRGGLRVREIYFGDESATDTRGADLLRVVGVPHEGDGSAVRRSHTAVVDLKQPEDDLFAAFGKNTRYKIRRAEKDGTEALIHAEPGAEVVRDFVDYYDEFAAQKGRPAVFRPRLDALAEAGGLTLTSASQDAGDPLVWHAYARSADTAVLLYSASLFRSAGDNADRAAMGRANRFLHWRDIQHFKASGCTEYDLGGLDVEGRDEETAQIADFKRGFGGAERSIYAWTTPASLRGRLAYAALRARGVDF